MKREEHPKGCQLETLSALYHEWHQERTLKVYRTHYEAWMWIDTWNFQAQDSFLQVDPRKKVGYLTAMLVFYDDD